MRSPSPRGPLSGAVLRAVTAADVSPDLAAFAVAVEGVHDPLRDGDLQLALACCYELHYRGFDDVDDAMEWDPTVLALRALLERRVEAALHEAVAPPGRSEPGAVHEQLRDVVEADSGPSLSRYMLRSATVENFRDFLAQRSIYHLKEADPHTWVIPRVGGRTKSALVEIQSDEYGGGRPGWAHAEMFASTMRSLGLDDSYGAYWDQALPETLCLVNVMSLFGLHRRHRGSALGHLAALEMTSTAPNRRYGNGLRRLGFSSEATAYFDEHVEADAVHEQLAAVDLCGSFVRAEPEQVGAVLWGAAVCVALDGSASAALLRAWEADAVEGAA